jgi:hypothetical protein
MEQLATAAPVLDPVMMNSNNTTHAGSIGLELRVPQKALNEHGRLLGPGVQPHEGVLVMTKSAVEEIPVAREKRRLGQRKEQWQDTVISDAQPGDLSANDPATDAVA